MEKHLPKYGEDAYSVRPYHGFELIYKPARTGGVQPDPRSYAYFSLRDALCHLLTADLRVLHSDTAAADGLPPITHIRIDDLEDAVTHANLFLSTGEDQPAIILETDLDIRQLQDMTGIPFGDRHALDEVYTYKLADYNEGSNTIVATAEYAALREWVMAELKRQEALSTALPYQLVFEGVAVNATQSRSPQQDYVEIHHFSNLYEPVVRLLSEDPDAYDIYGPYRAEQRTRRSGVILDEERGHVASISMVKIDEVDDGYPTAGMYLMGESCIEDLEIQSGLNLSKLKYYDGQVPGLLLAPYRYDFGFELKSQIQGEVLDELQRGAMATLVPPESCFSVNLIYSFHPSGSGANTYHEAQEVFHFADPGKALDLLVHTDIHALEDSVLCHGLPYRLEHAFLNYDGQKVAWLQQVPTDELRSAQIVLAMEPWLVELIPATINAIHDLSVSFQHLQRVRGAISIPIAEVQDKGVFRFYPQVMDELEAIFSNTTIGALKPAPTLIKGDHPESVLQSDKLPAPATSDKSGASANFAIDLVWKGTGPAPVVAVPLPGMDLTSAYMLVLSLHPSAFVEGVPGMGSHIVSANLVRLQPGERIPIVSRSWHEAAEGRDAGIYLQMNGNDPACLTLAEVALARGATPTAIAGFYKDAKLPFDLSMLNTEKRQHSYRAQSPPGASGGIGM